MVPYEERLRANLGWALSEGSRHFEGKSEVEATLREIAKRLDEIGVPYSVVGGMALFAHGYERFTKDVDILVTREGLRRIHQMLEGHGYLPVFAGSKNLRDTEHGVKIEFLITGDFPGDGKPKSVAFPDPASVAERKDGIAYLNLKALVELKLASGISSQERGKDLVDVQALIAAAEIPRTLGDELDASVRPRFFELWDLARARPTRYLKLWRNKFLSAGARSLPEMEADLRASADLLKAMLADGVTLDPHGRTADDHAHLVTTDPVIAKKYDMHDEREFLDADDP